MLLPKGVVLTMRKEDVDHLNIEMFRHLEWFRPPGYDNSEPDSYGDKLGQYITTRRLNLLNLGKRASRKMILKNTSLSQNDIDPDNQYCGHAGNEVVHKAILESKAFRRYDGTIISTATTEPALLDDLEGAEEVVLFTSRNRNALLRIH